MGTASLLPLHLCLLLDSLDQNGPMFVSDSGPVYPAESEALLDGGYATPDPEGRLCLTPKGRVLLETYRNP